jgi:DNA topoisomerase-2
LKKTTAAKPKATTKAAAPKKPVQSKLKMSTTTKAVPKKRKSEDSDAENSDLDRDSFNDDSLLSNTPPAKKAKTTGTKKSSGNALAEIENESFLQSAEKPKTKPKAGGADDGGDKYQKISHIQHILLRPDTYIGSIEFQESEMWVYNSESDAMEHRKVNYVPGLYKIFDEVLVNAADNKQNDKNMDEIKVTVDRESGEISVWNNGRGIPIEIHKVRSNLKWQSFC